MVVRGDDFMVAGCGDDLDWLSQKLNEKLELVAWLRQRGNRVGPLCDKQRLWTDVEKLTRDTQSWQWQSLDSRRRVDTDERGRCQAEYAS